MRGMVLFTVCAGVAYGYLGTVGYFCCIGAVSFLLFAFDKWRAIRQQWRIPERILLLSAFLGGAPFSLAAMFLFRHKTAKPKFYIFVILALLLHLALFILTQIAPR